VIDNPMYKEYCSPLMIVLAVLVLSASSGCSRGDGRQPVHGTVTLDGQPLTNGIISFQPVSGLSAPSSGAAIDNNGKFSIPSAKGLMPGKYAVTVQVWRETDRTFIDPGTGKPQKITAPIPFKETGHLQAAVVAGGVNQLTFHLTSGR
jgi:hypothetical protein